MYKQLRNNDWRDKSTYYKIFIKIIILAIILILINYFKT